MESKQVWRESELEGGRVGVGGWCGGCDHLVKIKSTAWDQCPQLSFFP